MHNTITFPACFIVLFGLLLISCSNDDGPDPNPTNSSFSGTFVSAVHQTSGTASINGDETILTLTNFQTDSGPDLNIYLAASSSNVTGDFIDLGDIKGINGTYTYDLPENVDFGHYKFVVVWCVDFSVNFGFAELMPQ